ncbi:MAG: BrnA antitoxin family protein, partial [Candidatus Omnitrophica bacterium]|nr:BrnA antitoxin family protein [Candidatus Omnitrophota bacterium]
YKDEIQGYTESDNCEEYDKKRKTVLSKKKVKYMKKKRIPKFKTEQEEAKFWDKNSPMDYLDEMEEVEKPFDFNPEILEKMAEETEHESKKMITLRIEPSQINLAKIIAKKEGRAYQTLIRVWIKDKIKEELEDHPEIVKEIRKRRLQHK